MQERRYRPGDVLDDYCPRERRITDHAIVAMVDDEIQRTRCGICDAEHEYKAAKVPAPRRKTQPPALFTQVLDTMNGPQPPQAASAPAMEEPAEMVAAQPDPPPVAVTNEEPDGAQPAEPEAELEGGFRRSLIRATFPRPEGTPPAQRSAPEFTIQSLHNRRNGQRHAAGGGGGQNKNFRGGRRRQAGGGSQDHLGPMRFRDHGQQQQGNGGQGQGQGQGGGGRRRRGKKNR